MARLKRTRCYLAGPIDRVADSGATWRNELTTFLVERGVQVFNPLKKPINVGLEDDDQRASRKALKEVGNFDAFVDIMKLVRTVDLRMVDVTDFLICNLDLNCHMCGTYEELFLANRQKKPIVLRCEQGKAAVPDWLFAVMPHQMMFSTWDEVREYLTYIDISKNIEHLKRWMIFDAVHSSNK